LGRTFSDGRQISDVKEFSKKKYIVPSPAKIRILDGRTISIDWYPYMSTAPFKLPRLRQELLKLTSRLKDRETDGFVILGGHSMDSYAIISF
jgi:hypothetical protein